MKSCGVTIRMKPFHLYFYIVLLIQFVVPTFESVDDILWCYHSNETLLALLSHGTIYSSCSLDFWICGWILSCDHSNDTSSAVISRGTVYLVCSCRGVFLSANPETDFWSEICRISRSKGTWNPKLDSLVTFRKRLQYAIHVLTASQEMTCFLLIYKFKLCDYTVQNFVVGSPNSYGGT